MTIKDFTEQQKQALLDLVTLMMYADGHLASAEDERVSRLLTSMGFTSDYDRARQYDAAVARVRSHTKDTDKGSAYLKILIQAFPNHEQRRLIDQVLDDVITSDSHVADAENQLMAQLKEYLEKG